MPESAQGRPKPRSPPRRTSIQVPTITGDVRCWSDLVASVDQFQGACRLAHPKRNGVYALGRSQRTPWREVQNAVAIRHVVRMAGRGDVAHGVNPRPAGER